MYIPDSIPGADGYDLDYTIHYRSGRTSGTETHSVLKADALSVEGADLSTISGSFVYPGSEEIRAGDICATGYGEVHGIENKGTEDLEMIALIVLKD